MTSFGREGFTEVVEIAQGMQVAARDTQLFQNNGGAIDKFTHANRQQKADAMGKLEKPL